MMISSSCSGFKKRHRIKNEFSCSICSKLDKLQPSKRLHYYWDGIGSPSRNSYDSNAKGSLGMLAHTPRIRDENPTFRDGHKKSCAKACTRVKVSIVMEQICYKCGVILRPVAGAVLRFHYAWLGFSDSNLSWFSLPRLSINATKPIFGTECLSLIFCLQEFSHPALIFNRNSGLTLVNEFTGVLAQPTLLRIQPLIAKRFQSICCCQIAIN